MKTDDLIDKLSAELKPVKPLMAPLHLTAMFSFMGLILVALSFLMMSKRSDLQDQFLNPVFLTDITFSFLLAVVALALSTHLSRPGQQNQVKKISSVTIAILAMVLVYDGFRVAQLSQAQIHLGLHLSGLDCFFAVLGYAVMLGVALIAVLKKGASMNPKLSGLVVATACVGFGNVAIAFFCGNENGMHILAWHFAAPMIAALGCGLLAGRYLLRW